MFKFSRISDFRTFTKIRIREFFSFCLVALLKKNREILEFANLSASRNSQKLKPREYYQIYSILRMVGPDHSVLLGLETQRYWSGLPGSNPGLAGCLSSGL